ncbi:hypothetical protein WKI65_24440 [Streptomyces sp. MS1.AVA.3]|uniref:hypothetical protein n=1 Tax=Streptomyces decoyicus TaxID=249567 RepID=UPI0030BCF317
MSEETPPTPEPEDAFVPIAHDLDSCGLRCRLLFSAPLDKDPRWWRQLTVSGVPVGFLQCEPDTDPATQAKDLAYVAHQETQAIATGIPRHGYVTGKDLRTSGVRSSNVRGASGGMCDEF